MYSFPFFTNRLAEINPFNNNLTSNPKLGLICIKQMVWRWQLSPETMYSWIGSHTMHGPHHGQQVFSPRVLPTITLPSSGFSQTFWIVLWEADILTQMPHEFFPIISEIAITSLSWKSRSPDCHYLFHTSTAIKWNSSANHASELANLSSFVVETHKAPIPSPGTLNCGYPLTICLSQPFFPNNHFIFLSLIVLITWNIVSIYSHNVQKTEHYCSISHPLQ